MPAVASKKSLFRVSLKGFPVTGITGLDGKIRTKHQVVTHYRPTAKGSDQFGVNPDQWYTAAELQHSYGMSEDKIPEDWRRAKRPDVSGAATNYRGLVIEADDRYAAIREFRRRLRLRRVNESRLTVEAADPGDKVGPFGRMKSRKADDEDSEFIGDGWMANLV